MAFPFLTARWTHLFLATYGVPQELLRPRLPSGFELDMRDGQAFVSLVAFHFRDTRFMGVPWPGYRDFAELNLRFYVRRQDERGVIFIREFVSQRLVAGLAWLIYNEPYRVAPFRGVVQEDAECVSAEYELCHSSRIHRVRVKGRKPAVVPDDDSTEHFFKEHRWGYGRTRQGHGIRYEVDHPVWEVFPIEDYRIDLDWATVYGPEWDILRKANPYSTIFAAGSAVAVYPKGKL